MPDTTTWLRQMAVYYALGIIAAALIFRMVRSWRRRKKSGLPPL